jgi:regulator of sirC expression with transglutaminase-like and TPR domain
MRRAFAEEVAKPDESIRLEYAALLVGAEDLAHEHFDLDAYLLRLEDWAAQARERLAASSSKERPQTAVETFNHFMFEELELAGNQLDYYDPLNSYLHKVIDRRTGIPITLSIIYMEVARRAGLLVEGIGFPGHFIVRVRERDAPQDFQLVDPFNHKTLRMEDCQERLDEAYDGRVRLTEEHLRAINVRAILVRLLTNLKAIYARAELYRQALSTVERILLVAPQSADERRDRGALLAQLGRLPEAIREAEAYLQLAPDAADAEQVREHLKALQRRQATLN